MLRFHKTYFLLSVLLFVIEVLIALYVRDSFIRPYFGDFLVVILLYCGIRSFLNIPVKTAAIAVLLFAYAIETAQYFQLVRYLGLEQNAVAKTVIGSSFEWGDMLAYTLGILVILWIEQRTKRRDASHSEDLS